MVVAALSAWFAAPASAAAPATGGTPFGGASAPVPSAPPPVARTVTCRTGCSALTTARPGGTVSVLGSRLGGVTQVVFTGGRGSADDVSAPAQVVDATHVVAVVPQGARTGPVALLDAGGTSSRPTKGRLAIGAGGGAGALAARVVQRRVLVDGTPATLELYGGTASGTGLSIDLLHEPDGAVVAHWNVGAIPSGTVQSITWDATVDGQPAPEGRYEFHVSQAPGGGAVRAAAAPPAAASFLYLDHVFPVRGAHTYGDGFGAPRPGHAHQGVDVLGACGVPLVAARGGVVKYAATDRAAGNYVVIDAAGTDADMVYMHMRDPSLLGKGDSVRTGQQIGFVGRSGDASACHLHFEEWPAPGWYTGGQPSDPLADLKAWDALS